MSTPTPDRVQAGIPAGGQFATTAKTEPDITLTQPGAPSPRATNAAARVNALWSTTRKLEALQSAHAAAGLASHIRDVFPTAATISMEECDQFGCERLHVASVSDAAGVRLSDTMSAQYEEHVDEEMVIDFESSINANVEGAHTYLKVEGNERRGYTGELQIDVALANPATATATSPAERADETLKAYQALHDDLDVEAPTVARDLMADLHTWARANDVDLQRLFDDAGELASDEEGAR